MKFKIGLGNHYDKTNEQTETKYLVYKSSFFGFETPSVVFSSSDVEEAIARRDFLNGLVNKGVFD